MTGSEGARPVADEQGPRGAGPEYGPGRIPAELVVAWLAVLLWAALAWVGGAGAGY